MSYNTQQPSEVASALRALRAIRLSVEDLQEHGQADVALWAVASILETHYGVELGADTVLQRAARVGAAA